MSSKFEIDHLTRLELVELNEAVINRLKTLEQGKRLKHLMKFNVGDLVSFPYDGEHHTGVVKKVNQKTLSIILDTKEEGRISPALIEKIETPSKKDLAFRKEVLPTSEDILDILIQENVIPFKKGTKGCQNFSK